ncbi:MAG: endolytic transglycosylase MltG [Chloroflexota bacterium]|nr:endolytic transglycosylase MltG [Chloroflexota bacterium]
MTYRPVLPSERDQERMARIRGLREQRVAPLRRRQRFQPAVLVGWFLVVMVIAAVAIGVGFVAFAPRLMSWVEDNPGALEHGLVVDFVKWYRPEALADEPATASQDRITIEIPEGASDTDIGQLLYAAGLVSNPLAFQYAVMQSGQAGLLEAGPYDLSPDMRPSEIVAALHQEDIRAIDVTIREGLRIEEIAATLAGTELTMNVDTFVELVRNPPADLIAEYDFLADLPAGRSLEGYLYPNTYSLDVNWTAREVVEALLNGFGEQLTPEIRDGLTERGWSIDDAVILASIVEREAVLEEERPLIAGVFINRLEDPTQQWVLNADPTLQYALATVRNADLPLSEWGNVNWWQPLEVGGADIGLDELPDDLQGYQTYLIPGLPPTPIAAPRASSLSAVAFPDTEAGYFYFVAACPGGERTGEHRFAATQAEHEQNIQQALAECPAP